MSPRSTKSLLRRALAGLLLVAAVAFAAGCGGEAKGDNDADAQSMLKSAFAKSIRSADVKLDAQLTLQGLKGFDKPLRIEAAGPYIAQKGRLPKIDVDLNVGAQGQGQSVQTGFLSTGDRAFLKFGGESYEQPKANVDSANKELAASAGKGKRPLGVDPASWLRGARDKGDEKIGGVDTDHVSARVDVRALLSDLNGLAKKGANAVGGATTPRPLTAKQLDQAAGTFKDPTFDVYVGKEDGLVHRVSGTLALSVPAAERSRSNGITGGSLRFTLDLAKTNGDQKVTAPTSSRPIADLSKQLGGAAALGGLGAGGGSGSGSGSSSGTSTTPSAGGSSAALKRYTQCLDRTAPGDTAARAKCADELNN